MLSLLQLFTIYLCSLPPFFSSSSFLLFFSFILFGSFLLGWFPLHSHWPLQRSLFPRHAAEVAVLAGGAAVAGTVPHRGWHVASLRFRLLLQSCWWWLASMSNSAFVPRARHTKKLFSYWRHCVSSKERHISLSRQTLCWGIASCPDQDPLCFIPWAGIVVYCSIAAFSHESWPRLRSLHTCRVALRSLRNLPQRTQEFFGVPLCSDRSTQSHTRSSHKGLRVRISCPVPSPGKGFVRIH